MARLDAGQKLLVPAEKGARRRREQPVLHDSSATAAQAQDVNRSKVTDVIFVNLTSMPIWTPLEL